MLQEENGTLKSMKTISNYTSKWYIYIGCDFLMQKGTETFRDSPLIWAEMIFDENTDIFKIMKAIHNPVDRKKWDKDIE